MTPEELRAKLDVIRENLEAMPRIPQSSFDEFRADFRNLPTALHLLQTTIQALMDLGGYACARLGVRTPATSRDILENLESAGHLPAGSAARFGPIFGFRNRVVHLYDRIEPRIVFGILVNERHDLAALCDLLLVLLQRPTP
ncbi:MAG: DUF86 domain-containing protein [Planctomycetes bacterium]|nr:DUF86 domain-containing protein [Planctomycetota bacterium]